MIQVEQQEKAELLKQVKVLQLRMIHRRLRLKVELLRLVEVLIQHMLHQ